MRTKKIYVKLLNEGTEVWRPVMAEEIGSQEYRIIEDGSYDLSLEEWEFAPGSKVICEMQEKSEGTVLVAIKQL